MTYSVRFNPCFNSKNISYLKDVFIFLCNYLIVKSMGIDPISRSETACFRR